MPGVRVTVRLSGPLAERLGPRRAVELPDGATVGDLLDALDPTAAASLAVVVDGAIVPQDHALEDDDELAVLAPVAGG
jgi:sulfur carrier protein ThiS